VWCHFMKLNYISSFPTKCSELFFLFSLLIREIRSAEKPLRLMCFHLLILGKIADVFPRRNVLSSTESYRTESRNTG